MYRALNHDHRIMANPYLQTVLALQYIKGPNVQDQANDQFRHLNTQIQPSNPVPTTDNALWDDFVNAFTTTYTDTTAQQIMCHQLQGLKMRGHNLDTYVARFTHLCTKAQVDKDTMAIRLQFARGLHPELCKDILQFERPNLNTTFDEWVTKARNQQKQDMFNAGLLYPGQLWIKWQTPMHQSRSHHHGHSRGHTNDTPMDVDVEPVTQVYKAYTEIDKKKHCAEGRCFECSRQGHMVRECPTKKKQLPRPSGKENCQYSGYKE